MPENPSRAIDLGGGVHQVMVPFPSPLKNTLVYAMESKNGLVLVDAGWDDDAAWAGLQAGVESIGYTMADIEGVVLTHFHPDHTGLVGRVREASGAWIGMQLLMRRPEITGFVSVSPPANMYDFSFLAPCPASGLVINGTADKVAPPKDTVNLVNKLHEQKGITITHTLIEGADHFFKDDEAHMAPMIDHVSTYVRRRITEQTR